MPWLLGGPSSPLGWAVGFVEAGLAEVIDNLTSWRRRLRQDISVTPNTAPYPECLRLLDPLQSPWTQELLVEMDGWTAYLNNDLNGGDPFPASSRVSEHLGTRCVVAVHQPRTSSGHASTQLQVLGPEGEPPLMYIRTLAAHAEDGRWSWETSGTPLPFEDFSSYGARLVRNRLTRALLVRYLV